MTAFYKSGDIHVFCGSSSLACPQLLYFGSGGLISQPDTLKDLAVAMASAATRVVGKAAGDVCVFISGEGPGWQLRRHAYEGFCEDLARQTTVAHLSQLQLRFRRRHTWVSMASHMGFSRRRGVLKATI
jgi:hypothetical protein